MQKTYDYIIVGGGSAGSILASRLSSRTSNHVLLCEAGEDTPDGRVPEAILDSRSGYASRDPRFIWSRLRVTTEAIPHNEPNAPRPRLVRYEQARVLGGGSSINGQLANRGAPRDYDEWEQRGAAGWRWETVLPYFRKIERDIDFDGPLHGSDGRIPVRRVSRITGRITPRPLPKPFSLPVIATCRIRMASFRTAITRSQCPTSMTGGFPQRSAISARRSGSGKT